MWIVLPESKSVIVVNRSGAEVFGMAARLPATSELPGLELEVSDFFVQIGLREP